MEIFGSKEKRCRPFDEKNLYIVAEFTGIPFLPENFQFDALDSYLGPTC